MSKTAVVILAGTDSHSDTGRVVNGLETAKEFADSDDDDVEVVFDGAGTEWVPELADPSHDLHGLYRSISGDASACSFCTDAFGVDEAVADTGVPLRDEHDGHPSIRGLIEDGYDVVTF